MTPDSPLPRSGEHDERLGESLVPVVFGGMPVAGLPPPPGPARVVCIAPEGRLLGVVAFGQAGPPPVWGGLTIVERTSFDTARALADSTSAQLALAGIDRGSHHCVVFAPVEAGEDERSRRREQVREALRPALEGGSCRIVYERAGAVLEPELPLDGLVMSTAAATLAGLEHLELDPEGATVAFRGRDPLPALAAGLRAHGLRPVPSGGRSPRTDVAVVDEPGWRLRREQDQALRARLIVSLGPVMVTPRIERRLNERGIVLIPDTLAASGTLVATDLVTRGLTESAALSATFAGTLARARQLLRLSADADRPLTDIVRGEVQALLVRP